MNPLFETSVRGITTKVYKDQVTYRPLWGLGGEVIIPIAQVASVHLMPNTVVIEATGGKRYSLVVKWADKKLLRDAIFKVQEQVND
jgi:hypothetical protein